jgi:methionine sulfoxide reductase heme-binding subunit
VFQTIIEKRYTVVGLTAYILLSLLAITSFDWWKVKLRRNWKRLHQLVYLTNLLVVLHYAWAMKGDIFRLRGNIYYPLLAGVLVLLLLAARLPFIRKRIAGILRRPFSPGQGKKITGSQPDTPA